MNAQVGVRLRLPDRPRLSREAMRALIAAAQDGDKKARNEAVEANLKLVLSVVHRFQHRAVDLDDLFQAGCVGLMRAVDKFDLSYDVAFSTFAVPLILGEIRKHLSEAHPVKVGRQLASVGQQAARIQEELTKALGRSPTPAEVGERMGMPAEDVVAALDAVRPPASLDQPLHEDGSPHTLGQRIPADDGETDAIEGLALAQTLASLNREEREFLRSRFIERLSQTQLAEILGCSQAHVSRMERRILERCRRMLAYPG